MRHTGTARVVAAALLASLAWWGAARSAGAQAGPFTLAAVAGSGLAAAGGGSFAEFLGAPSIDRGQIAFRANTLDRQGVFLSDPAAGVVTVLDTLSGTPGGPDPFAGFGALSLDRGQVAVIGHSASQSGVYLAGAGAPAILVEIGAAIAPGSTTSFAAVSDLSLSQGRLALMGVVLRDPDGPAGEPQPSPGLAPAVLVGDAGGFAEVAANGTPAPPSGALFDFGAAACCVSLTGGRVVFSATPEGNPSAPFGVYAAAAGGPIAVVADPATDVAGDGTAFTAIDRPAADGDQVVFTAAGATRQGVYLAGPGGIAAVADTATPVPGRAAGTLFGTFGQAALHRGHVAFKGCTADLRCGVYTTLGGALAKIAAVGDELDGKAVADVEVGREAISCASVAFLVRFADGTQAVYRADLAGAPACAGGIDDVGPLQLFAGLRNSDDQGVAVDFRAELRLNGALVAAGEARCVRGLTRNPARALAVEVPFAPFAPPEAGDGDELALAVLARIGSDGEGARCTGRGASHTSATGVRLYFDSQLRAAQFGLGLNGEAPAPVYLGGGGPACVSGAHPPGAALPLTDVAPAALLAECADSAGLAWRGGNAWRPVATWTMTLGAADPPALAAASWRDRLRAWLRR